MATNTCVIREDEGGGGGGDPQRVEDSQQFRQADQQTVDILVKHLNQQQLDKKQHGRRASLPTDDIELTTLSGVVMRRKQQLLLQARYQQQQSAAAAAAAAVATQQVAPTEDGDAIDTSIATHSSCKHLLAPIKLRPLSISSISSAASSNSSSSSSASSSSSSGIQSLLTRNGSLNYGHEFRKQAYLANLDRNIGDSRDALATATPTASAGGSIEIALKNLQLSPATAGQFSVGAAARAAALAAGESQRRGFSTPGGSKISRINRSLHASLRYDKNTAYRIHQMANARALFCDAGGSSVNPVSPSSSGSITRNNSSTSSDSGHNSYRPTTKFGAKCSCAHLAGGMSSSASSVSRVDGDTTSDAKDGSLAKQLFKNKAATLDGATRSPVPTSSAIASSPIAARLQHHPNCSFAIGRRPSKASTKLQPSPSSASSRSNTSSLFRDDGFEDDLTSTASELTYQRAAHQIHRISSQSVRRNRKDSESLLKHQQHEQIIDDDEYQSCEEEFSNSHTTASTTSNLDDCSLSIASSSLINHEPQVLDKVSLANAKQQYRKSLLLEHQHQQHLLHATSGQTKIQALLQPPPSLCHLQPPQQQANLILNSNATNSANNVLQQHSSSSNNNNNNANGSQQLKQSKCDDRTVNIIGHMPTRSPGYWDSNLSITQRVVTEIIETERAYVDDLEQIVTGYICFLRNVLKQQRHQQQKSLFERTSQRRRRQQQRDEINQATASELVDGSTFVDDETMCATNEIDDYDVEDAENGVAVDGCETKARASSIVQEKLSCSNVELDPNLPPTATIISATDIKKLFSNLEDIYKFNKDLLFRLEECYLNPSSVAECFVENASGFEVYTHYCTVYPQVVTTLTELMANPTTAQLLKERQNELNQSLPLGAYLLKPVQRILKYHILFQSLIKHTIDDDSINDKDRVLIDEAFSVMTSIACHINAMKKRHEHAIRVQEVQGLLCGWNGPDLTALGELILEDSFKLCNRQKSSRHLFLFENVLLITKKKRDESLCYKGHIECSNLMLIEKIEGQSLVFNTVPFDNPKALCAFQAKNLEKKRDWCLQMKEVILKSFECDIPAHVKDLLMSLTSSSAPTSGAKCSTEISSRATRAPNYLERKRRVRQTGRKK